MIVLIKFIRIGLLLLSTAITHNEGYSWREPKDISLRQTIRVIEGSHTTLRCESSVVKNGAVPKWSRKNINGSCTVTGNGNPCTDVQCYTLDNSLQNNYNLQILKAAYPRDNGVFKCLIRTGWDAMTEIEIASYSVVVLRKPGTPVISSDFNPTVTEGIPFDLNCSSSGGNPSPSISWYDVGKGKMLDFETYFIDPDTTLVRIRLTPSRKNHKNTYKCIVWNEIMPMGSHWERSIELNVIYPPNIEFEHEDPLKVEEGKSVTMRCNVDSNPRATNVQWRRNGKILSNTFTYTIYEVKLPDAGKYTCTADNGIGRKEVELTLDVHYSPRVYIGGPQSIIQVQPEEGKPFSIQCNVNSNPPCPTIIEWFREDGSHFRQQGSILRIDKITANSAGNYTCRAINWVYDRQIGRYVDRMGFATVTLQLGYQKPSQPIITPEQPNVREGDEIALNCTTVFSEQSFLSFRWCRRSASKFQQGDFMTTRLSEECFEEQSTTTKAFNVLHLHPSRKDNGAIYTCEVRNSFMQKETKEVTLNVKYGPKVTIVPKPIVEIGKSFTLECNVDANPSVNSVTWVRNGKIVATTFFYTKEKAEMRDAGTYVCIAKNEHGQDQAEFTLDVGLHYAPSVRIEYNYTKCPYQEKEEVMFNCIVDANPPPTSVEWSKTDDPRFKKFGNILKFTKITPHLAGKYMCSATNWMYDRQLGQYVNGTGCATITWQLFNQEPSQPIIFPQQPSVKEGDNVALNCSTTFSERSFLSFRWCRRSASKFQQGNVMGDRLSEELSNDECFDEESTTTKAFNVLNLNPSRKDNGAIYACEVRNSFMQKETNLRTEVTLNVKYRPKVQIVSKQIVEVGKSITLECNVDANPNVNSVTWIKNGETVATTFIYTKERAELQDAGTYICIAENELGKDQAEYTLYMHYAPKVTIENNYTERTFKEGEEVIVKCIVDANPPPTSVEWSKTDDPKFQQLGNMLNITKITRNMAGKYICRATNWMYLTLMGGKIEGTGNASLTLDVIYPPSKPTITLLPLKDEEQDIFAVKCNVTSPGSPLAQYSWCIEYFTVFKNDRGDLGNVEETKECRNKGILQKISAEEYGSIEEMALSIQRNVTFKCLVWNSAMPSGKPLDAEFRLQP